MKLSELIRDLAAIMAMHGDLLILPGAPDGKLVLPCAVRVEVVTTKEGKGLAVLR